MAKTCDACWGIGRGMANDRCIWCGYNYDLIYTQRKDGRWDRADAAGNRSIVDSYYED